MEDVGGLCITGIGEIDANIGINWGHKNKEMEVRSNADKSQQGFDRIRFYYLKPPIVDIHSSVKTAIKSMVELDFDAVVSVSFEGAIEGIVTDKDICYKVVYQGLDLESTDVLDIMTPNPRTIVEDCRTSIALSFMVRHNIRHLPVLSVSENIKGVKDSVENDNVNFCLAGIIDISRCVFDRLDDLEQKVMEDHNIVTALDVLERRGALDPKTSGTARANFYAPDIKILLDSLDPAWTSKKFPELIGKNTVYEACGKMFELEKTAVVIVDDDNSLMGIFTTKDLVYRVLAKDKDPRTTLLSSVCTPQPISIEPSVSLLSAISIMKDRNIKHLPVVMDGTCLTVLEVSEVAIMALEYLFHTNDSAAELALSTSAWKDFWDGKKYTKPISTDQDSHNYPSEGYKQIGDESCFSNSLPPKYSSSIPGATTHSVKDSSSIRGTKLSSKLKNTYDTFNFKLKMKKIKKAIRFKANYTSIKQLKSIAMKEIEVCCNIKLSDIELCYVDTDGDEISLVNDRSLLDAVHMFIESKLTSMELHVTSIEQKKIVPPSEKSTVSSSQLKINKENTTIIDDTINEDQPKHLVVFGKNVSSIVKYANMAYMVITPLLCISLLFYFKSYRRSLNRDLARTPERLFW